QRARYCCELQADEAATDDDDVVRTTKTLLHEPRLVQDPQGEDAVEMPALDGQRAVPRADGEDQGGVRQRRARRCLYALACAVDRDGAFAEQEINLVVTVERFGAELDVVARDRGQDEAFRQWRPLVGKVSFVADERNPILVALGTKRRGGFEA